MKKNAQKQLGKYYTITNPFSLGVFKEWFSSIPNVSDLTILEPFAGSNNIVKLMNVGNTWECYDIAPTTNAVPEFTIKQRDTIKDFPRGYSIGITNPPYLAKNSATRRNLLYQGDPYDDLYKKCLELMLNNLEYIAAIIPESFITSGIFQDRLTHVISLTCKMFDDTECPVCLALFSKNKTEDFFVYRMDDSLGLYNKEFFWYKPVYSGSTLWRMTDPNGEIGLIGIDTVKKRSIQFIEGEKVGNSIKTSSRNLTRISPVDIKIKNLPLFLKKCNEYLNWYRDHTEDVFLSPFKGLRTDGKYRRRLDYETAKAIMDTVILRFKQDLL